MAGLAFVLDQSSQRRPLFDFRLHDRAPKRVLEGVRHHGRAPVGGEHRGLAWLAGAVGIPRIVTEGAVARAAEQMRFKTRKLRCRECQSRQRDGEQGGSRLHP